jgi:hypothetical protein
MKLLALVGLMLLLACAPGGTGVSTPVPTANGGGATPTPVPADAIDLNCDGRYERVVTTASGNNVTAVAIEAPYGSSQRHAVHSTPNAEVAVIENPRPLAFGGCEQLLVVPVRFSGSGSILQLMVFRWTGSEVSKVFDESAQGGRWASEGQRLLLTKPVYLYNEPNCCPCTFQERAYAWDGTRFNFVGETLKPAEPLPPPTICTGTPVAPPP